MSPKGMPSILNGLNYQYAGPIIDFNTYSGHREPVEDVTGSELILRGMFI